MKLRRPPPKYIDAMAMCPRPPWYRHDDAFTLVELMVAILLIAILLTMGMATLAGTRARAQDRRTQTAVRDSLSAAKTLYTAREDYSVVTALLLQGAEPVFTFVDGATSSSNPKTLSVNAPDADTLILAAYSVSGRCMWVKDTAVGGTAGTLYAITQSDGTNCMAGTPPAPASFTSSWFS